MKCKNINPCRIRCDMFFVVVYHGNKYITRNRRLTDNIDAAKVFGSYREAVDFVSRDFRCGLCRVFAISDIRRVA